MKRAAMTHRPLVLETSMQRILRAGQLRWNRTVARLSTCQPKLCEGGGAAGLGTEPDAATPVLVSLLAG